MLNSASRLQLRSSSQTGSPRPVEAASAAQPGDQPMCLAPFAGLPGDIVALIGSKIGSPRDLLNFAAAGREVRARLAATPEFRRAARVSTFLDALLIQRGSTAQALADHQALGHGAARLGSTPKIAAGHDGGVGALPSEAEALNALRAVQSDEARSRRALSLLQQGYRFSPQAQMELWRATENSAVEKSTQHVVIGNLGKFSAAVQDEVLAMVSGRVRATQPEVLRSLALQIPTLARSRQKNVVTILASAPAPVRRIILTDMASVLHLMPKPVQKSWFAQACGASADEMARPMFSSLLPQLIDLDEAASTRLYAAFIGNAFKRKAPRRALTDRDAA